MPDEIDELLRELDRKTTVVQSHTRCAAAIRKLRAERDAARHNSLTESADRDRLAAEVEEWRRICGRSSPEDYRQDRDLTIKTGAEDAERMRSLSERVRELEQELEKARFAARQFCGAHIGVKFDECPRCWGDRQGEKAAHFDRRVRELEADFEALRADFEYASGVARSAFCREEAVPDGLDPTFYHTGSASGDREIMARLDAARERWARKP